MESRERLIHRSGDCHEVLGGVDSRLWRLPRGLASRRPGSLPTDAQSRETSIRGVADRRVSPRGRCCSPVAWKASRHRSNRSRPRSPRSGPASVVVRARFTSVAGRVGQGSAVRLGRLGSLPGANPTAPDAGKAACCGLCAGRDDRCSPRLRRACPGIHPAHRRAGPPVAVCRWRSDGPATLAGPCPMFPGQVARGLRPSSRGAGRETKKPRRGAVFSFNWCRGKDSNLHGSPR